MNKVKAMVLTTNQGISIGNIQFNFPNTKLTVLKKNIDKNKIANEKNRFNDILQKTKKSILSDAKIMSKTLDKVEMSIFNSYIDIIDDPELFDGINSLIEKEKVNVEYAIKIITEKYIDAMQNMDNEYFKQRATDLITIQKKLLHVANEKLHSNKKDWHHKIIVVKNLQIDDVSNGVHNDIKGFLIESGVKTSHAIIMLKKTSIPAIVGINKIDERFIDDEFVIMDATNGDIIREPSKANVSEFENRLNTLKKFEKKLKKYQTAKTKSLDNCTMDISVNINDLNDIDLLKNINNDGIGLLRTEFIYMEAKHWPTEDEQIKLYKKATDNVKNKVIFRTLDIGADKQLSYYKFEDDYGKQDNDMLGIRGIRFTLQKPSIFKTQLKSLLQANKNGNLWIMLPMVVTLDEIKNTRKLINNCIVELKNKNIYVNKNYKLGIMIETPFSVYNADNFAKHVDFFSIGTNDLMQYSLAADRLNSHVAYLWKYNNNGFLRALKYVIDSANKHKIYVSLCGSLGAQPKFFPFLVGMGIKSVSVPPKMVPKIRYIYNNIKVKECRDLLEKVLKIENEHIIYDLVEEFLQERNLIF